MRILFIHNRYGRVSGEELMLERIISILTEKGHLVDTYFEDSSTINSTLDRAQAFISGVWSSGSRRAISKKLEEFKPDIVQIQNLYPLISPSVLPVIRRSGTPIVMRLSNYRLMCPNGLLLSHGKLCQRCRGGNEFWCILKNCESQLAKSTGYAVRNVIARKLCLYSENVDFYYAQTEFQKALHVDEGYNPKQINVIPNMVEVGSEFFQHKKTGAYIGFVGRLSVEKGAQVFVDTAKLCPSIEFKMAGAIAESHTINSGVPNLTTLGHLEGESLKNFILNARIIVVPSLCYEGFPSVIIEAMSMGTPVFASNIGGLGEIVKDHITGRLFSPANALELAELIMDEWENASLLEEYSRMAFKKVLEEYTPDLYYSKLMRTYNDAIDSRLLSKLTE